MNEDLPEQQSHLYQALLSMKGRNNLTIPEFPAGIGIRHFTDPFAVVVFICPKRYRTLLLRHFYYKHI